MRLFNALKQVLANLLAPLRQLLLWLIEPRFTSSNITEHQQARLLAALTLSFWVLNLLGIFSTIGIRAMDAGIVVLIVLTFLTLAAYVLSRTRRHYLGAQIFIYGWTVGAFINAALTIGNPVGTLNALLAFVFIMASALFSIRALVTLTLLTFSVFFLLPFIIPGITTTDVYAIAGTSGTVAMLVLVLTYFRVRQENYRLQEIQQANAQLKEANQELIRYRQTLEERVEARTNELSLRTAELEDQTHKLEEANQSVLRRAAQLQSVAEVARSITNIESLDMLLPDITRVVSENFGFYHVGIFLADENNEYAVLAAANSEGGQRMLRRGHRLKISAVGIVGNVVGSGMPRIALDTGEDAVHFKNPDLPETRSEMALPLRAGNTVIGALDVQSTMPNAFNNEDVEVLSILADLISIAIQNARQYEATQKAISEAETIYRQYLRTEWSRLTQRQEIPGFTYTLLGTRQIPATYETEETRLALERGELQIIATESTSALAVPIKLRDEVLGVLNVRAPAGHEWLENELDVIRAVAERVAISAENARLFEETTSRAERERIVAEITNKIRSTNDPNEMLRTALDELKRALNASKVQIVPLKENTPTLQAQRFDK